MRRFAFYIDSSACSGCKACQAACRDKNDLAPGVSWRRIYEVEGGNWKIEDGVITEKPFAYYFSMSCNHCEDTPCVDACPTTALHKTLDGIVVIDKMKCMGCNYCEWTCPYKALKMDSSQGIMTKCDMCEDYIYEGKNPACVDACPMRALEFGYYDTLVSLHGSNAKIYPLPGYEMTRPSVVLKVHPDASKATNDNASVNNLEVY
jgi:anaerobic dimethyl sulfoxide reductase subunit B (iron-sulfur subunit)